MHLCKVFGQLSYPITPIKMMLPLELPCLEDLLNQKLDYSNKAGIFINTLPFRCRIEEEDTADVFFKRIQKENVELQKFQYTSINDIKEWNAIDQELFDTLWIF